jgi:hypothetical protein
MQNKVYLKLFIAVMLFAGVTSSVFGQEKSLSIDNTLDIVRKFHPVIKQSFLQNEISKNELVAAKGIFDPSIQLSNQEKNIIKRIRNKVSI